MKGSYFALHALFDKRGRIAGEIKEIEGLLVTLRADLVAVDATILLFDPKADLFGIPSIQPLRRCRWFGHGEQRRLCLEALRKAGKPMTVDQIVQHLLTAKAYPTDPNPMRVRIRRQTAIALARLAARGVVRRVVTSPHSWWELALE